MGYRNEIRKEQFANDSARRILGFDDSGAPTLMGNADIVGYYMRWFLTAGDVNNRFQIEPTWTGFHPSAGLNGSQGYSGNFIPFNSSLLIMAYVDGISDDYTEGYGSVIVSKWIRAATGVPVQIGATTKMSEQKTNVGATSGFSNPTTGSIFITFDSGQVSKQYNWSLSAIYALRKYA